MIMVGFDAGGPAGPTGAHPIAVEIFGEVSASNAVLPPAECPTAATKWGLSEPKRTELEDDAVLVTASSERSMIDRSRAGDGLGTPLSAWLANPLSR